MARPYNLHEKTGSLRGSKAARPKRNGGRPAGSPQPDWLKKLLAGGIDQGRPPTYRRPVPIVKAKGGAPKKMPTTGASLKNQRSGYGYRT